MALWTVAYLGIRPFASLIDGASATLFGLRFAALLMTVPTLIGAIIMVRLVAGHRGEVDGLRAADTGATVPVPPE